MNLYRNIRKNCLGDRVRDNSALDNHTYVIPYLIVRPVQDPFQITSGKKDLDRDHRSKELDLDQDP